MGLLTGKVCVVTGAGGGIGRGYALTFAREGARVVVNDLGGARDGSGAGSQTMAEQVVQEIQAAGGEAVASYDDVAERAGAENIVKTAVSTFGQLDVLVNNAGILRDKTLAKMEDAMFDLVVRVHLRGTYLCTQAAARHMIERKAGGRIINTTSIAGMLGNFGQTNYAGAKAGIYGFTRSAAIELRKAGITVNAIAPVAVTRLTEDLPMIQSMPNAKEILSPDAIAPGALFLASDLASDVTGTVLAVEGARCYLFKVIQTPGATARDGKQWTASEIKERWTEITG